jgi:hypothetical protein
MKQIVDTVTRLGVNTFSDCAVRNNVTPTAVTLSSFRAAAPAFDLAAWFANLLRRLEEVLAAHRRYARNTLSKDNGNVIEYVQWDDR